LDEAVPAGSTREARGVETAFAHALAKVAVAPEKPRHRSLSKEARDAFASGGDFSVASQPALSLRDRHDVVSQ
jgi:hypothetical protein